MNKNADSGLSRISRYRSELFGLSIISIIIFHFCENVVKAQTKGIIYTAARFFDFTVGSVGVEIFLFLSGMGLYFSLKKNGDTREFYKRRMSRVLLPYVLWGGLYWIGSDIIAGEHSVIRFLLDFSFVTLWTEGERALWYIGLILIMYLVFPLIFKLIDSEKYGFLSFCIMLALSVLLAVVLMLTVPSVYKNTEIAVTRVSVFLVGTYIGKRVYKNDRMKPADYAVVFFGAAVRLFGVLQRYGVIHTDLSFYRYESMLFSIALIYFLVWVLCRVKFERVMRFLRGAGALSLELYMTHVTIDNALDYCGLPTYRPEIYILVVALSIISSILLHFAVKKIIIYKTGKLPVK